MQQTIKKRLSAWAGICLSLFLTFQTSGCFPTNDNHHIQNSLSWYTLNAVWNIDTQGAETNVEYLGVGDATSNCISANPNFTIDANRYLDLTLKAETVSTVKIEICFTAEDKEYVNVEKNIVVTEDYSVYGFYFSGLQTEVQISKINVYPTVALGDNGTLSIKNVKVGDDSNAEDIYILPMKENATQPEEPNTPSNPSVATTLAEKYDDYFKIGMTANYDNYTKYASLENEFNSFTCENEMKLYTIAGNHNSAFNYQDINTYDFSKADQMVSYMQSKGKKVRGHCLIWYNGAPDWIKNETNKQELLNKVQTYCYNVVKHFTDKFGDTIYAWDVANEIVGDDNQYRDCFYNVAGLDFVETAFRAARQANPTVKLYYNDYNMDNSTKRNKVIEMLTTLIQRGMPIDGVGLQSHYDLKYSSGAKLENAILAFKKLASDTNHSLDIQITELDIKNYDTARDDQKQANLYRDIFSVLRRYQNDVSSVTFWGVADDYSWLDGTSFSYYGTGKAHPMLFDEYLQKKQAYYSVFDF